MGVAARSGAPLAGVVAPLPPSLPLAASLPACSLRPGQAGECMRRGPGEEQREGNSDIILRAYGRDNASYAPTPDGHSWAPALRSHAARVTWCGVAN